MPQPGRRLASAVALALLVLAPRAAADTWTSTGPPSGGVRSFAVDPDSRLHAFAATPGGVWRTLDGTTWVKVLSAPARDVAVDGTRVVVAAEGGVWRSLDDGASWTRSEEGFAGAADRDVRSVALGGGATVYAGTGRGVLKSTDGAVSFAASDTGLPDPAGVEDLAAAGATVYAATVAGVYRSTDAGDTWSEPQALTGPVTSLASDPTSAGRLWAVQNGSVYRTANIGTTGWTAAGGVSDANAVAVRPAATIVVYAATDDGPRASDDAGATFDQPPAAMNGVPLDAIGAPTDAGDAGTVYASGSRSGVFRSANDGGSWTATGALPGVPVGAVAFEAAPTRTFWAGGAGGVLRSTDGGATWQRREAGLPALPVAVDLAADPHAPGTAYAALASGGVYRTTDGGGSWTAASAGLPSATVRALATDPQSTGLVHAATALGPARSANGGLTWMAGTGLANVPLLSIAVDPASPSVVLAGTAAQGVWRSTNGGTTWTVASSGALQGAGVPSLLAGSGVALAGTDDGVWRSSDGGASWIRATVGLPDGIAATGFWQHPALPSVIVMSAGADGLYRSRDGGVTWRRDDIGLDAQPLELAGDAVALAAATAGDSVRLGGLQPDLGITASASPAPVLAGELVTITIGVPNGGSSPASAAKVAVTLPAGFAVREAAASQGSCTTIPLACDVGTIAAGSAATMTVVVRPTVAGTVPVTIAASAAQPDANPADDTRVLQVESTDTTAPRSLRMKGTTLGRPFQTGIDIQLGWSAVDAGTGVSRYDVRYRKGTPAGKFAPAVLWQDRTARTNALFSGQAGSVYCFSVRAVDVAGNVSRYSTEKCTAIPLDDSALARRGSWAREASRTAFGGATLRGSVRGAILVRRGVHAKRISLLATVCRGCGTVEVRLGSRLLKTVSLHNKTTRTRQLLPVLTATGLRSGTLTIRVVSSGRPVRIDGLGLSPR